MPTLDQIVSDGARYLQQECSRRGVTTSVPAPPSYSPLQRVPLAVNVDLPGVGLSYTPSLLYKMPQGIELPNWLRVWGSVSDAVADHDDLRVKGALLLAHPRLPYWRGLGGDIRSYIAQFLYGVAWYTGKVSVLYHVVELDLGHSISMRVDQTGMELHVGKERSRRVFPKRLRTVPIDYLAPIVEFPYQTAPTDRKVYALYLHLCQAFPDLVPAIRVLFGAACQSDHQQLLLEPFDVYHSTPTPKPETASGSDLLEAQDLLRKFCG